MLENDYKIGSSYFGGHQDYLIVEFTVPTERQYSKVWMYDYCLMLSVRTSIDCREKQSNDMTIGA
jgi:hypothetical protein